MATSQIEPGDIPGVVKTLEFIEGRISLLELTQWASDYAKAPWEADRDSHVMARLILALHGAQGEHYLRPLLDELKNPQVTDQSLSEVIMQVTLAYAAVTAAGMGAPQA